MANYTYAPIPGEQYEDNNGNPLAGGLLYTYIAGSATPQSTYSNTSGTPNANPVVLDSAGRATILLQTGQNYKFVLNDSTGALVWSRDNISAVPTVAANVDVTGTAGETITAGQAVYLSDGSGSKVAGLWYKADSANAYSSTTPEVGLAPNAIASGASGSVRINGLTTGLAGLTPGVLYYIGTGGALTATAPTNARLIGQADTATSLIVGPIVAVVTLDNTICDGRLTLTTATPVTTADVLAATTVYFTPYAGNRLALYDGSAIWSVVPFTEISIAVPATTSQMYDVWVYNNSGTPTLEVTAWTNDTTRATALVLQNGVLVKTGATTRRYVGSFRTTGVSGQTEDSAANRLLWNYYNRATRYMRIVDTTDSWGYNTPTWRQANNTPTNHQVTFIVGVAEDAVSLRLHGNSINSNAGSFSAVAIGVDSITVPTASQFMSTTYAQVSGVVVSQSATYDTVPAVGYHYAAWLEYTSGNTGTIYGDNGGTWLQSGLGGVLRG